MNGTTKMGYGWRTNVRQSGNTEDGGVDSSHIDGTARAAESDVAVVRRPRSSSSSSSSLETHYFCKGDKTGPMSTSIVSIRLRQWYFKRGVEVHRAVIIGRGVEQYHCRQIPKSALTRPQSVRLLSFARTRALTW